MLQGNLIGQRLVALCFLGLLLFNYPLLALFNDSRTLFGIPLLYAYLFFVWALFICLLAIIAGTKSAPKKHAILNPARR